MARTGIFDDQMPTPPTLMHSVPELNLGVRNMSSFPLKSAHTAGGEMEKRPPIMVSTGYPSFQSVCDAMCSTHPKRVSSLLPPILRSQSRERSYLFFLLWEKLKRDTLEYRKLNGCSSLSPQSRPRSPIVLLYHSCIHLV